MSKEDIIGGLTLALEKGENLEQAMLSFFNAGYKREDVEGAARALQALFDPQSSNQTPEQSSDQTPEQTRPSFPLTIIQKPKRLPQSPTLSKSLKPVSEATKKLTPVRKPLQTKVPIQSKPLPQLKLAPVQMKQPLQIQSQIQPQPIQKPQPPSPIQRSVQEITPMVSSYETNKSNPRSIIIVTLLVLLVILILFLGGVFLFKDYLVGFFNNLL